VRHGAPLDTATAKVTISAMQASVREFTRKFPAYRRAALAGREIRVQDRAGNGFVFRAAHGQPVSDPVSLAEAMGDLIGSVSTGRRKKSLAGYGRD
jgi:hypothetical protein